MELSEGLKEEIFSGEVDPGKEVYLEIREGDEFYVRNWRVGDRYRALGAPGSRKLQDMFTDKRIGRDRRKELPVICEKEGGVVWCPGFPVGEERKLNLASKRALHLTYIEGIY